MLIIPEIEIEDKIKLRRYDILIVGITKLKIFISLNIHGIMENK